MDGVPNEAREKLADHLSPYVGEALAGIKREAPHILDLYRERADAALADILPILRKYWEEQLLGDEVVEAANAASMAEHHFHPYPHITRTILRAAIDATKGGEG
jgi:hypothetical protein